MPIDFPTVTYTTNVRVDKKSGKFRNYHHHKPFDEILRLAIDGKCKSLVNQIRAECERNPNSDRLNTMKVSLPAFTPSMRVALTENSRDSSVEHEHTGIVSFDFDHVDEECTTDLVNILGEIFESCVGAFVSPSGQGVKAFFKVDPVPTSLEQHTEACRQISERMVHHLNEKFDNKVGDWVDSSTWDITRLCFLSYDPDAYLADGFENRRGAEWDVSLIPERAERVNVGDMTNAFKDYPIEWAVEGLDHLDSRFPKWIESFRESEPGSRHHHLVNRVLLPAFSRLAVPYVWSRGQDDIEEEYSDKYRHIIRETRKAAYEVFKDRGRVEREMKEAPNLFRDIVRGKYIGVYQPREQFQVVAREDKTQEIA